MGIFDVIMLLGGIALFLFGMNVMSTGLEKLAGGRLDGILRRATSNPVKSFALGTGITAVIQSSSAVTVMLVGLVNSGIMTLHQTVGVILGTNVGTTITAWILSLTGLAGSSFIVKILKPDNFAHIFAVVGIILFMFISKVKQKNKGEVLLGFAVLIAGMTIMRSSVSGLENSEAFRNALTTFTNPLLAVLLGLVVTAIIQSSSASVGILQALSLSVSLPYMVAIPIIMGQNIGTCVTALLSSIGTNRNAKRVAFVHVYFNIIGTVVFMCLLYILNALLNLTFLEGNVTVVSIAIIHTFFNLGTTLILAPFTKMLEKLAKKTVKDTPGEQQRFAYLDERLLVTPTMAIAQCRNMIMEMSMLARDTVMLALEMVMKYNDKTADQIRENEEYLDAYEDHLNTFMLKLSGFELSESDGWHVGQLLHIIGDLERMGDHALNILESVEEIRDKDLFLSENAIQEADIIHAALLDIVNMTIEAFRNNDISLSYQVEPLEQVIDNLTGKMRSRHIARMQKGECSAVIGLAWSDLLINYERISDHCSNIAFSIIQSGDHKKDRHVLFTEERIKENTEFIVAYNEYESKYELK